jgi:hypothetical protein
MRRLDGLRSRSPKLDSSGGCVRLARPSCRLPELKLERGSSKMDCENSARTSTDPNICLRKSDPNVDKFKLGYESWTPCWVGSTWAAKVGRVEDGLRKLSRHKFDREGGNRSWTGSHLSGKIRLKGGQFQVEIQRSAFPGCAAEVGKVQIRL